MSKKSKITTKLPLGNRQFRQELGKALLSDSIFAKDMSVAAAQALAGDPLKEAEDDEDRSFDETRELVWQALKDKYKSSDDDDWLWIVEQYDDRVIFDQDGSTWESTYSIDENENVTIGDRVEVEVRYVPVVTPAAAREAQIPEGDLVPLIEAFRPLVEKALRPDNTVSIKVIEPGRGSSGFYPTDVIERDAPLAFPAGTKMFWDHPTESEAAERPERSIRDLAAELVTEARYNPNGPEGPGAYAEAKVFGEYKESIDELAAHIGTSIHAHGKVDEAAVADDGRPGVVEAIASNPFNTIDFVTAPGAGGKVMELFESARGRRRSEPTPTPPAPRKEEGMDLKEAQDQLTEAKNKLAAAEQERDQLKEKAQEADRLVEAALIRDTYDTAMTLFEEAATEAKVNVPTIMRKRIAERLADDPPKTEDGKLDKDALGKKVAEAIKTEAAYLAEVTGSGRPTNLGDTTPAGDNDTGALEESLKGSLEDLGVSKDLSEAAAKI